MAERQLIRPEYAKPAPEKVPETRPSAYIAPVQEKTSLPRWMRRLDREGIWNVLADHQALAKRRIHRPLSNGPWDANSRAGYDWLSQRLGTLRTGRMNAERVRMLPGLPLRAQTPHAETPLVNPILRGDLTNNVRQAVKADSANLTRQLRQAEPELPVDLSGIIFNRPPKLAHVKSSGQREPIGLLRSKHSVNQGMLPWIAMAQENQMTNLRRFGKLGLGLGALGALGIGGKMAWDRYNAPGKYHQGQAPNGSFVPSAAGWDADAWGASEQAYTPEESNQVRQGHAVRAQADRLARPGGR